MAKLSAVEEVGIICPDCEGKGTAFALIDGAHYRGPMCVLCSRCKGTGETDPQTECRTEIGGTHQMPAELSALENSRADPARLLLDTPEELRATDGTAPDEGLSGQQLDEVLAWLLN